MIRIFRAAVAAAVSLCCITACTGQSQDAPKAGHVFFICLDGWGSYSVDDAVRYGSYSCGDLRT